MSEDTCADVAELTQPQDTLVVILCGPGALVGDRLDFATNDGTIAADDLVTAMGTAAAQKRAFMLDATGDAPRSEFALRGAAERMARCHKIRAIASRIAATRHSTSAIV